MGCGRPPATHAGRTANPVPSAIDIDMCTNCNWMMAGCRFDAKRSLLLNYLPGALAHGAQIRPLHEVQHIARAPTTAATGCTTRVVDDEDYRILHGDGTIDAKIVIVAAGAGGHPGHPAALRAGRSARCRTRSAGTSPATASG